MRNAQSKSKCEWKECKLGDLVSLEYGKSLKGYQGAVGKYPVYGTNGKIGNTDFCLSPIPSVIIGRKGAYRGVHFSKTPFFVIDTAFYIKPKNKDVDLLYLYNFLLMQDINSKDSGSAIPSTDRYEIYDIDIPLPPLSEQRAIAGVLSSLDEKIDLLHRQNKTLEGMAEALWRKMFVEEAEETWTEVSLLDIVNLVGGGTPKTEMRAYWDGSIPWLAAKDITENHKGFIVQTEKNITEKGLNESSAKLMPKFATVISARGTVGNYCILSSAMAFSQSNYGILPKINNCFFFTYLVVAYVVDELKAAAYGSVFDTITTKSFKEQRIRMPSENQIILFEESIKLYFEKIYTNTIQIRNLSRMRDTLLPKLMSDEVRVRS
jgi:type I restriction enzyme S subunit